jgi:flagellar hook assembly protein FlgD
LRNYPNPFNPETTIQYEVKEPGETALTVFDVTGRKVVQLMHGPSASGSHEYQWNGKDAQGRSVPSGIYCCRLNHKTRTGEMQNKTLKRMLLK